MNVQHDTRSEIDCKWPNKVQPAIKGHNKQAEDDHYYKNK